MGQRFDFCQTAVAEVGTKEKPANSNKVKYNDNNGQFWCGYFVNWCAKKVKLSIPNCIYTPAGVAGFQGKGLWVNAETAKPKPGFVAFFDFPGGEKTDHVGIVVSDNGDGTVTTVEGNTTADGKTGSQSNGGEVAMKIRAYKKNNKRKLPVYISGFGTPKFKD
jgi:cell wall-associated NlpC family hydrolase